MVMVEEPVPGAGMEAGLKVAEAPKDEDKAMAELKPPETKVWILVVPELPGAMVTVLG